MYQSIKNLIIIKIFNSQNSGGQQKTVSKLFTICILLYDWFFSFV